MADLWKEAQNPAFNHTACMHDPKWANASKKCESDAYAKSDACQKDYDGYTYPNNPCMTKASNQSCGEWKGSCPGGQDKSSDGSTTCGVKLPVAPCVLPAIALTGSPMGRWKKCGLPKAVLQEEVQRTFSYVPNGLDTTPP